MEQIKNRIEVLTEIHENDVLEYDDLKPMINNMLMMYLPKYVSVGQADILAMAIYDVIINPSEYLNKTPLSNNLTN